MFSQAFLVPICSQKLFDSVKGMGHSITSWSVGSICRLMQRLKAGQDCWRTKEGGYETWKQQVMGFLFSFCSGELSVHVEEHYLINCHRPWLYVLCHSAQRCIEIHFMPQTEVVTQGFVLRCDPDSQQLCLCLASESQLSTSPAPAVIWNTYKAVANYMLYSRSLCLI